MAFTSRIAFEPVDPNDPTLSLDGLDLWPDDGHAGDPALAVSTLNELFEPEPPASKTSSAEPIVTPPVPLPAPAPIVTRAETITAPEFAAPAPRVVVEPKAQPMVRAPESFAPELDVPRRVVIEPQQKVVIQPPVVVMQRAVEIVEVVEAIKVVDAVHEEPRHRDQVSQVQPPVTKVPDAPIYTFKRRAPSEFQLVASEFRSFAEQFHAFALSCKPR